MRPVLTFRLIHLAHVQFWVWDPSCVLCTEVIENRVLISHSSDNIVTRRQAGLPDDWDSHFRKEFCFPSAMTPAPMPIQPCGLMFIACRGGDFPVIKRQAGRSVIHLLMCGVVPPPLRTSSVAWGQISVGRTDLIYIYIYICVYIYIYIYIYLRHTQQY